MAQSTSFRPGDLVRLKQNARALVPGIHEVVEVVPQGRERLYRVRGSSAAQERTVPERDLRRA